MIMQCCLGAYSDYIDSNVSFFKPKNAHFPVSFDRRGYTVYRERTRPSQNVNESNEGGKSLLLPRK